MEDRINELALLEVTFQVKVNKHYRGDTVRPLPGLVIILHRSLDPIPTTL